MKKFIAFIFCMTVIPALILVGAASLVYNKYMSPTPMEYDFLRGAEEIHTVEYVKVSFAGGNVTPTSVGMIQDVDSFKADILSLDCYKGIALDSFKALADADEVDGFLINYNDGSFEVITPYVCMNSELKINTIRDLLNADVYGFGSDAIFDLLYKYSIADGTKT